MYLGRSIEADGPKGAEPVFLGASLVRGLVAWGALESTEVERAFPGGIWYGGMEAMDQGRKIRILVAKVGLDGHDKGAHLVTLALRDAGMEVVYTGLRRTVDQVIKAAIEEDVDVIGISILSGAHVKVAEKLVARMKEEGIQDKLLVMGGVIPEEDFERLKKIGVAGVFTQNATYEEMIEFIREGVRHCREGVA